MRRKNYLSLYQKLTAYRMFLKIFILLILGIIFISIPKIYLGYVFPLCLFRILFDIKCLGCGTTRAVWSILHFKFIEAFEYNKLIVITFPLLIGCMVKWILKDCKSKTHNI